MLLLCAAAADCNSSSTSPTTTTETTTTTTTTTTSSTLPPNVTSVTPTIGVTEGGNTVTITGTGLTNTSAVLFGGVNALSFSIPSDSTVKAVSPPNVDGTFADVTVTTDQGTSVAVPGGRFFYTRNLMNRFTLLDSSVKGGATVVGSVGLQYLAPAGGYTLPVTWSSAPANATGAIVPESMRVEPGFITGSFAIQTTPVTSAECYLIVVTFPPTGSAASAAFCVVP